MYRVEPEVVMNSEEIVAEIGRDMAARVDQGNAIYGPIFNEAKRNRDVLEDIYEELLDALVYVWVLKKKMKGVLPDDQTSEGE